MSIKFVEIKKFLGIFQQQNSFSTPDGALEEADNVVITKDDRIIKRRGVYSWYSGGVSNVLNNVYPYQNQIVAVCEDKLLHFTESVIAVSWSRALVGLQYIVTVTSSGHGLSTGMMIAISNSSGANPVVSGNYSVTVTSANQFTFVQGSVAAGPHTLDYFASANINRVGSPTQNAGTVSSPNTLQSRFVESNNNLYFTTSDGPLKLTSFDSAIRDSGAYPGLDMTAELLASSGVINGNVQVAWRVVYGYRDANSNLILGAPSDIVNVTNPKLVGVGWTRTIPGVDYIVTVTSNSHNLTTGMRVFISNADGTHPVTEGFYTITVTGVNTFTFIEGSNIDSGHTLDYSAARAARLEFSVPSEVTLTSQSYFYQVYRTSQSIGDSATPTPNFKLVDERRLTQDEIDAGFVVYSDDTDDILLGAELYTNPNSREGELQANYRPPKCQDVGIFKNHVIYANCTTRHLLDLSVVDTDNSTIQEDDGITVRLGAVERSYVARKGIGNQTVDAAATVAAGTATVTYTAHGFLTGYKIQVISSTSSIPIDEYAVTYVDANTFTFTVPSGSSGTVTFAGISNGTDDIFFLDSTNPSIGIMLRNTAQGIVKAINRDASSLVYANYVSGISDVPGRIRITAKDFTDKIEIKADGNCGEAFSPVLPDSFSSGTQVFSKNERQPNTFYSSKTGEPEAVPVVNNFPVGPRNRAILRSLILRDSIIHLTEGGVFKTVGDNPGHFTTTIIDTTVICAAPNSAVILNNNVVFLSNQGVCLVTENSVEIISRRIEDLIQPILTNENLIQETYGVAYESDRSYLLSTIRPNQNEASIVYVFNILNQTWTSRDTVFYGGVVGPSDTLYLVSNTNKIVKERKTNTKVDFSDQNHSITVVSVAGNLQSATISITTAIPEKGDVIVKNNIFTRINASTSLGGNLYSLTFTKATNLLAADSAFLYDLIESRIQLAPFHGGMMGRAKQFTQMQIHLRSPGIYRMTISYSGYTYGGSDETEWVSQTQSGGWGLEAWGFFPWGQADAVDLTFGTDPAPVIRTYISRFQQRNTFIQPIFTHRESGEQMDIQALSFGVRPYMERVTK